MVFNPRYAVAYHPKGYFDPTRVGGNNAHEHYSHSIVADGFGERS